MVEKNDDAKNREDARRIGEKHSDRAKTEKTEREERKREGGDNNDSK